MADQILHSTESKAAGADTTSAVSAETLHLPGQKEEASLTAETTTPPPFPQADIPAFSWSGYVQGIGLMFLLLAALWFLMRLLRRYGRFNFIPRQGSLPRDAFFMEAQMPLGPRKSLMVVRFLKRRLLLGVTEQKISVLTEERVCEDTEKDACEVAKGERSFEEYLESSDGDPKA